MGKQAPTPGDYKGAAADSSSSTRPNVNNPFSTTQWTTGPDGTPIVTQGLSAGVQSAFDSMKPFDLSAFGQAGTGDQARQQTIDAAYNSATRRLDPRFRQQGEALNSNLANSGLDLNSAAARGAQRELAATKNDAYSSAMAGAIQQGNAAQDSVFRNNMMARQTAIADALRARQMPLEDLRGLQGFLGQLNYGQGADYLGAQKMGDDAQFRKWQAEQQATADLVKGAFSAVGGAASMFSDERLKTNITRLDVEAAPGIPLATWTWLEDGSPGVGVIAQDVAETRPDLVSRHENGFLMVDYGRLFGGDNNGPD